MASAARIVTLLLCLYHYAGAQQQGLLLNVSASGEVDPNRDLVQIACTIVSNTVPLVIFAEAVTPQTDPALLLLNLINGTTELVAENNDYITLPADQLDVLDGVLGRLPNRSTDAAIVGTTSNTALCAVAFEARADGPSGLINLSITDLAGVALRSPDPNAARSPGNPDLTMGPASLPDIDIDIDIDDTVKVRVLTAVSRYLAAQRQ